MEVLGGKMSTHTPSLYDGVDILPHLDCQVCQKDKKSGQCLDLNAGSWILQGMPTAKLHPRLTEVVASDRVEETRANRFF